MQGQVISGAYIAKNRFISDVFTLDVHFRQEGDWRTYVTLLRNKEHVADFMLITPQDHEVADHNWVDVLTMHILNSPGDKSDQIQANQKVGGVYCKTPFGTGVIKTKHVPQGHFFEIRYQDRDSSLIMFIENKDIAYFNTMPNTLVMHKGHPGDYDAYPGKLDPTGITWQIPAERRHISQMYELQNYVADFTDRLPVKTQMAHAMRGSAAYVFTKDMFKPETPDGLSDHEISQYGRGLCLKTIGKEFFYLESKDGSVKITLQRDPVRDLIRELYQIIEEKWKKSGGGQINRDYEPTKAEQIDTVIRDNFFAIVTSVMVKESTGPDPVTFQALLDFYYNQLCPK